jgi:hypothetical protein
VRYRRIKDVLNAALDQQPLPTPIVVATAPAGTFVFERSATELFGQVAQRC